MFQRNKGESNKKKSDEKLNAPPLKPFTKKGTHSPADPPTKVPDLGGSKLKSSRPKRTIDNPSIPIHTRHLDRRIPSEADAKRLLVGREIKLSGEITACEHLIVEGQVEVSLTGARLLEVTHNGIFKGSAQVNDADISGQVDGDLTVNNKLTVRSGGKISGSVRYGSIIIEGGGEVSGDMQTLGDDHEETS